MNELEKKKKQLETRLDELDRLSISQDEIEALTKEAMQFIEWLASEEGQGAIASFRDKKGNQLFIPNAK